MSKVLSTFISFRDGGQSIGSSLPENGQTVLVDDESMREHVATGCGEQVDLLKAGQFVAIKFRLASTDLRLDPAELFQLFKSVRIQLLRNVLHPHESSPVVVATLFHFVHGE